MALLNMTFPMHHFISNCENINVLYFLCIEHYLSGNVWHSHSHIVLPYNTLTILRGGGGGEEECLFISCLHPPGDMALFSVGDKFPSYT